MLFRSYSFAFDNNFHLRQMPKVDANGKPQLAVSNSGYLSITDSVVASVDAAATGGIAPRYAYHVMWKQPFPGVSSFTSLSIQGLS